MSFQQITHQQFKVINRHLLYYLVYCITNNYKRCIVYHRTLCVSYFKPHQATPSYIKLFNIITALSPRRFSSGAHQGRGAPILLGQCQAHSRTTKDTHTKSQPSPFCQVPVGRRSSLPGITSSPTYISPDPSGTLFSFFLVHSPGSLHPESGPYSCLER